MRLRHALLVALALTGAPVLRAQSSAAAPTVVILVRHAEKAAEPVNDPPLTARGTERAAALSMVLRETKVTAVYHTPTTRTRDSARPVAVRFG